MVAQLIGRLANSLWLMIVLFVFLMCALYFVANTGEHLDSFGQSYQWLMMSTAIALTLIGVLILASVWRLIIDLRQNISGSRLTLKLVIMLVIMALLPMTLVYSFSVKFLRSNIDSWFDVEVERALDDALILSRDSLSVYMRTRQKSTLQIATRLSDVPAELAVLVLNDIGLNAEASELTLIGADNRIVATTSFSGSVSVLPDRPADDIVSRARNGEPYLSIDPLLDGDLQVQSVVPVFSSDPAQGVEVLYATYPIPRSSSVLAANVQESFRNYRQLAYLREPLKQSSIATLTLAVFLSLMMAVWVAFYAARRLMVPVHDLVVGTRSVAAGDYSTRLHTSGRDELGYLVNSFNEMTDKIEAARASADSSQQLVEEQRSYLELVLSRISSGVITLDANQQVRTCNDSAAEILKATPALLHMSDTSDLQEGVLAQQFFAGIESMLISDRADWSVELELVENDSRTLVTCRGAKIQGSGAEQSGHVLVFDDFSEVVEAQRNAAWSEVARRLAHEIKNPLTPIQLSAERLQHKYASKLHGEDSVVLKRLTNTIVQQVESMKSMVKAFADYASTPQTDFVSLNLNELINETCWLYREGADHDNIKLDLENELPMLQGDRDRTRQVLHNVIKNAFETNDDAATRKLAITTRLISNRKIDMIELVFEDNGPGFANEVRDRLFEPYVTTKNKGTGLGLAIVKKIVEEHGGIVRAENGDGLPPYGGGRIVLKLPVSFRQSNIHGDAA